MTANFEERLNQILPKITDDKFLKAEGVGKDIPYFIFEYPPEKELAARQHILFLMDHIPRQKPGLKVVHINLFDFIITHLKDRGYLEQSIAMERTKGKDYLRKRLEKILHPQKLAPLIASLIPPDKTDLVLISGVGNAWPFLRASGVLNNLHKFTGTMPVVMFYPGLYDQVSFRLFGKVMDKDKQDSYYRAFRLIP
jgi:Domain of unknown function (DUF1788)